MRRLFFIIALLVVLAPLPLGAQTQTEFCTGTRCSYIPLEPLPGQTVGPEGVDFGSYLNYAFTLFIVIGGMFAVATFVWGGIMYMVSDVVNKKDFAKKQMTRSIWGIVLLLGSYILLVTINPQLVNLNNFNSSLNQAARQTNTYNASVPGVNTQSGRPTATQVADCQVSGTVHYTQNGWQCVAF